jgi:exosortase N
MLKEKNLKHRLALFTIAIVLAYGLAGWYFLNEYFGKHPVLFAGLLLAPYLIILREPGKFCYRYAFLSFVLLVISLWVPVKTLYFLALAFAALCWIESAFGRLNYLPLFLFLVLSPVFNFLTTIFGFPIRLQLSEWAGGILEGMGLQMVVSGNILSVNGTDFSVDPACVGLNMLVVSLIIALLLLAFWERKSGKTLLIPGIGFALLLTFGLNLLCNLIRIVLLVWFRILPENPLHDAVGMGCLLIYVIIPLTLIIPRIYRLDFFFRPFPPLRWNNKWFIWPINPTLSVGLQTFLLVMVLGRGCFWEGRGGQLASVTPGSVPGYQREVVAEGIYKYTKKEALLYVKPVAEFYDAEHTPLICWQGSGYEFKQIGRRWCGDREIYTGILQKGDDRIHTAWWFDNGQHPTISQSEWRWRMSQGEAAYSLINLNSGSEEVLNRELESVLNLSIIRQ